MGRVGNLSVDVTANTSKLDTNLQRSSRRLTRVGRSMSRDASSFNKKVSASFKNVSRNIALIEGPLGGVAGRLSALSAISGTSGVAILGVAVAVGSLGLALTKAGRTGDEFIGRLTQINALIKTTGGAAGQTAAGIREFAQDLARGTLASVKGVEDAATTLLSFRRISGDTFKRAIVLAQDLSATFKTDLKSSILQIGKALEDPILGITALSRSGVTFSLMQKEVIKTLVETGQAAEAQRMILDELARTVGGAGAAEGGPIAKAYDSMAQSVDNFFVALSTATGIGTAFTQWLEKADGLLQDMTEGLVPIEDTLIKQLADATEQLNLLVSQSAEEFKQLKREGQTDEQASAYINDWIKDQRKLVDGIQELINAEDRKAAAIKATATAVQAEILADEKAGRVAAERKKVAEQREKDEQRRQQQIQGTIESLRQAVNALEKENNLLMDNAISIEDAATAREVLLMQQKLGLDAMNAEGQVLDELIKKRNTLKDSIKAEAVLRDRVTKIIADNKTEVQKLNEELREFEQLRKDGELTEKQYQLAIERTNEKINDLDESQQRLKETVEEIGNAAIEAFKGFVTGAKTAAEAVRDLGLRLLDTFANKALGSLFDEHVGPAVGDILSGLFSGKTFAGGGRPPLNQASVVGENGPELFVPDTAGTIIPNDQLGGGGARGLTIFADMRGASVEAVARLEAMVGELNGSIEPRAIDAVVSEKQRNPALFGGA